MKFLQNLLSDYIYPLVIFLAIVTSLSTIVSVFLYCGTPENKRHHWSEKEYQDLQKDLREMKQTMNLIASYTLPSVLVSPPAIQFKEAPIR